MCQQHPESEIFYHLLGKKYFNLKHLNDFAIEWKDFSKMIEFLENKS